MSLILVVEDEADLRFVYKKAISKHFKVLEAENGITAFEIYKKENPDLVVLDSKLPDISGIEVTKMLIDYDPNALIIGATGYLEMIEKFVDAGAVKAMPKPFTLNELINEISLALNLNK